MQVSFQLNGKKVNLEVAHEDMPLLWLLRDTLNLKGTKFGCGIGQCGACTVHLNGSAVRSCLLNTSQINGKEITTIEGLGEEDQLHPVQQAWKEMDVPQCGYCQAGQMMTAASFLSANKTPSKQEIRVAMHGNICRCAAYNRIEKAVEHASELIRNGK